MKKEIFLIEGMTCSACSGGIERALRRKEYIKSIQVNLITQTAILEFDEQKASLEDIWTLIKKLGYRPYFKQEHEPKEDDKMNMLSIGLAKLESLGMARRIKIAFACSLVVLYLSMVGMMLPSLLPAFLHDSWVNAFLQLFCSVVVMVLGAHFYIKGFKGLWHRNPHMDSLIALSTTAAFVYSVCLMIQGGTHEFYFESIVVIITLVMFGKNLEEHAKKSASDAVNALLAKQSKEAIIIKGDQEVRIPIEQIAIHDTLKILPGGSIPVDGILIQGEAYIDESMLTGEPLASFKQKGDKLFAGSLNTTTSFLMSATSDSRENTLQAMVRLIEEAAQSKTKMTRIADKVASVFVPSVIMVAVLAGGFWAMSESLSLGLEIFVSVLVISCPCALGLATPMAVMIGSSLATQRGLFFKHAEVMERSREVSAVVFDKTGTLTHARLNVVKVLPVGVDSDELLRLAASIEQGSEHLIALAIVNEAEAKGLCLSPLNESVSVAGYGMNASIDGMFYRIGSLEYCGESNEILQGNEGLIAVCLKQGERLLGVILLEDSLKQEAKACIEAFHTRGIKSYIVSGDHEASVKRIADLAGVSGYVAGAKPEDKLQFIRDLKAKGEVVMMVGDGINDVAALQASDVSVSFSHASDVSYQSAEVIICNENIINTYAALMLGEAIATNIKQNLFWAFCYNVVSIPLACGVLYAQGILLNPMIAAVAMSLSSLSVVANAQRLRKFKLKGIAI